MYKTFDVTLNSDNEENYELMKRLGLSDDYYKHFKYLLLDDTLTVRMNLDNGDYSITAVNGKLIKEA